MHCKVFEGNSMAMKHFSFIQPLQFTLSAGMYSFPIQCVQLLVLSFLIPKTSCFEGKFCLLDIFVLFCVFLTKDDVSLAKGFLNLSHCS